MGSKKRASLHVDGLCTSWRKRTQAWTDLCAVHEVFVNHPSTSLGKHGVHVAQLQLVALETAVVQWLFPFTSGVGWDDINTVTATRGREAWY